jgi:uncharacterized repeat protein (TIGR03803 family)
VVNVLGVFNSTNGRAPSGGVTLMGDGSMFGVCSAGGINDYGTLYKISSAGAMTTLVYFNGTNGWQPNGKLTLGVDGQLYGMTAAGGNNNGGGPGSIFKITTGGGLTKLHTFSGPDGANPGGGLTLGSDGNFHGVTSQGGNGANDNSGVAFTMTPGGTVIETNIFF